MLLAEMSDHSPIFNNRHMAKPYSNDVRFFIPERLNLKIITLNVYKILGYWLYDRQGVRIFILISNICLL